LIVVVINAWGKPQMKDHALIIQNKGGGHGEIGYHLALTLAKDKGLAVTILNDKYSESKQPFKVSATLLVVRFMADERNQGLSTTYCFPSS